MTERHPEWFTHGDRLTRQPGKRAGNKENTQLIKQVALGVNNNWTIELVTNQEMTNQAWNYESVSDEGIRVDEWNEMGWINKSLMIAMWTTP